MGSVSTFLPCSSAHLQYESISNSTYTFSPVTGLIHVHRIDSIHPAPHQAVYDALRASLVNVFGLGERKGIGAGAACGERGQAMPLCKVMSRC